LLIQKILKKNKLRTKINVSSSTAVVALIIENYCFIANLGNSRAVLTYTDTAGTVIH